jgi:hypothetical protein
MAYYIPNYPIDKKTCIGDSLQTINASFSSLDTNLYTLSSYVYRTLKGYVLLKIGNVVKKFEATADTDVARMQALKEALQYAQLTPSIPAVAELSQGNFKIPTGYPLATYATNTVIVFDKGSSVTYENPNNAKLDTSFYRGPRNVLNFGAIPRVEFSNGSQHNTTYQYDCLPAFNAAHYSIPVSEANTGEPTPALSALGLNSDLRFGSIFLPAESGSVRTVYYLSDTWYISGFITVEGENREVTVTFQDNRATVEEKFVIYLLANWSLGPTANGANTFCASLNNFSVAGNSIYNPFSSGVRFTGNQGGTIPWLRIYDCSLRGFVTDSKSGTYDVGYLWVSQILRGPAISLINCTNFSASQIVSSFVNNTLWAKDSDGDYYSALYLEDCFGTCINSLQNEDVITGVKMKRCNTTNINAIQAGPYSKSITNATNTNPISVTTPVAHGRTTGDRVTIRGVLGNTAANINNVAISVINSTQFSLSGITGNGPYTPYTPYITSGGTYYPGVNYGALLKDCDHWDINGQIYNTAYFLNAYSGSTSVNSVSGVYETNSVIGRHANQVRLNPTYSFVYDGGMESRAGNITFSTPNGAIRLKPGLATTATFTSSSVQLALATLPTSNPGIPGRLWLSGADLKVSL